MSRGRGLSAVASVAILLAGCSLWWPTTRVTESPFERADVLTERGEYEAALAAYDEILARKADAASAPRARLLRDMIGTLLKLRAALADRDGELEALRQTLAAREGELVRLQRDVSGRDTELGRLRAEIATRQAEIARLTTESEQLRADLDQLKRSDLRLEQRRR
jgi:chromosome segregation ATPase